MGSPNKPPNLRVVARDSALATDGKVAGDSPSGYDGDGGTPDMEALMREIAELRGRITQMPTAFQISSWAVSLTIAVIAIIGAVTVFTNSRIDRLADKIDALPDRINSNMTALTQSLSAAITASKQSPPQVILMPAPSAPAAPAVPAAPAKKP